MPRPDRRPFPFPFRFPFVPNLERLGRVSVDAWRDALAVLSPVSCSGCGRPDRSVCAECLALLVPEPRRVQRRALAAWAALEYAGPVAAVIGGFKDGGRTDAAAPLARALRGAIAAAIAEASVTGPLEVCTIPSTAAASRARGYSPVDVLLGRCGIRSSRVLRLARDRADQAGLGAEARRANAAGGLVAERDLAGRRFLLVDDVLTTGSTLAEASRALTAAGADTAAIAVLAETPLRYSPASACSRERLRDFAGQGGYGGRTGVVDPPFRPG
ncbi:ComF family protein [Agromyces ramosus]|uniref:Amidophosphoribosyltransferase n=1 Tax=Agromyces ramosus TaxID=33879 RepID=A0ABU0RBJ8_9MICO|nr:phosphoribosyltransferase family protein [Agromyces ramosus]MDQ0895454.1 putative amidophosphoribosyltransferase [Agromyces ramosus]